VSDEKDEVMEGIRALIVDCRERMAELTTSKKRAETMKEILGSQLADLFLGEPGLFAAFREWRKNR
jgi:hypothetical protein